MQGASTFAILVLFFAQPWASRAELIQPCNLAKNGQQLGSDLLEDQGAIPMSEGAKVRVYVPESEDKNVIGSSLLFCDDQLEDVVIELAQDKRSYIVTRQTDSEEDSYYWIKLVTEEEPPVRSLQYSKRPAQLRRLRY